MAENNINKLPSCLLRRAPKFSTPIDNDDQEQLNKIKSNMKTNLKEQILTVTLESNLSFTINIQTKKYTWELKTCCLIKQIIIYNLKIGVVFKNYLTNYS